MEHITVSEARNTNRDICARQGDDSQPRHLLTFASAGVADEWWQLVQQNFPDSSRPGPQLFSFERDTDLDEASRHEAFKHLQSKWMYIQNHDAPNVATRDVIPAQNAKGKVLGGSAPTNPEMGSMKPGAKAARSEVSQLEQHFEKMMGAVERNSDQIAALAQRQAASDGKLAVQSPSLLKGKVQGTTQLDMGVLGAHLDRINGTLERNAQHVESLSKRQQENEERLRTVLEENKTHSPAGSVDMTQLSSHLDRIQDMLEKTITERKNNANGVLKDQQQSGVDFRPLTEKLGKVEEAMEQNSAFMKALLEEGSAASAPGTPFPTQEKAAPQIDMSPLATHLENIHKAIEQQSSHMQELVGFASGDGDSSGAGDQTSAQESTGLAPLGEHLEQIYNAVEDGNSHMKDLVEESTTSRMEAKSNCDSITAQLEVLQEVVECQPKIDMETLTEHLLGIRNAAEENAENMRDLIDAYGATSGDLDIQPLADHLDAIRETTDKNSGQLTHLVENTGTARSGDSIDFTPLTERLNRIHSVLEQTHENSRDVSPGGGNVKFIMTALSSHLSKIQAVVEQNAQHVKGLREKQSASQDKMHIAITQTAEQLQALAQRAADSEAQRAQLEAKQRASEVRVDRLAQEHKEVVGVLKELAANLKATTKGECEHVISPPPRKVGRRIVGFVYEGDDRSSTVDGQSSLR